jgi:predicted permease
MNILNFEFGFLQVVFKTTGSFVTPLALLSVGLQLRFDRKKVSIGTFGIRSLYKLILTPALIYVLYVVILQQHSKVIQVAVLESAMAPMITACILASTHGLKPRLSSMMIGFGIPLSFVTPIILVFFGSVYLNVLMRVLFVNH